MSAYLFAGCITQMRDITRDGRILETIRPEAVTCCRSQIVYGGNLETATASFQSWLLHPDDPDEMLPTTIAKVVVTPFMEQLLNEAGYTPIDWPKISEQMAASATDLPVDDFEQGYWVDVNEVVPLESVGWDVESLERNLAEDIRSGLNWSPEKQFFFQISALCPPAPPVSGEEADVSQTDSAAADADDAYEEDMEQAEQEDATFPELMEKEMAALIQARNSVVAAWLWRRYAASTRLADNPIRIDPWCGTMPAGPAS